VAFNKKAPAAGWGFAYLKCMKIEFDKAILWLIPYLYLISVLYYWGYWGTLNVDVFNYYPVTDLVKGITAPLRFTLSISLFVGLYFTLMKYGLEMIERHNKGRISKSKLFALFLLMIGLLTIDIMKSKETNYYKNNLQIWEAVNYAYSVAVTIPSFYINKSLSKISTFNDYIRYSCLCIILTLPVQALYDGHEGAIAIQSNSSFEYIVNDSITNKRTIYKYLGKAGDYQVLETLDNYQRIIIPATELTPLILEYYRLDDRVTLTRFRINARRLSSLPSTPH
jgi:hypothetical protein